MTDVIGRLTAAKKNTGWPQLRMKTADAACQPVDAIETRTELWRMPAQSATIPSRFGDCLRLRHLDGKWRVGSVDNERSCGGARVFLGDERLGIGAIAKINAHFMPTGNQPVAEFVTRNAFEFAFFVHPSHCGARIGLLELGSIESSEAQLHTPDRDRGAIFVADFSGHLYVFERTVRTTPGEHDREQ